jgi:hypothetical protein
MDIESSQYVDAALKLHGLTLDESCRAEVENQFNLLESMMQIVDSEPLPAEIESANIFRL